MVAGASGGKALLLRLQGAAKADPEGHVEDFRRQLRRWRAGCAALRADPRGSGGSAAELGQLAHFLAQVAASYPAETRELPGDLQGLLRHHHQALDPGLRQQLVQALTLLRHRGQLEATDLAPLFFQLFHCRDKGLRRLMYGHMVQDLRKCNQGRRDERTNRAMQAFLYKTLDEGDEVKGKKAMGFLCEMYRRNVWRDAKSVNVIANAAFHKSPHIMVAALKFFMGHDDVGDEDEDGDSDDEDDPAAAGPTRDEIYRATKKGTVSTKKKKQKKLKRAMHAMKKAQKSEKDAGRTESFSAIQLLHDPQGFAEKLFARLQQAKEGWSTRLLMLCTVSRVVGVHQLLLVNYYPFLQRYCNPHQRDVTQVLAATIQATHDLVPEDLLWPVVYQIAMQFVSDKCQPEVMQVGIKSIREICMRQPNVMNEDLLQDLAQYKKDRNKGVSMAARSLIGVYREIYPLLLTKKDRGKGADLDAKPKAFGEQAAAEGIDGLELLAANHARGSDSDSDASPDEWGDDAGTSDGEESEGGSEEEEEEEDPGAVWEGKSAGKELRAELATRGLPTKGRKAELVAALRAHDAAANGAGTAPAPAPEPDVANMSVAALKKHLKAAKEKKRAEQEAKARQELEGGFLTQEDFRRIKELKREKLMEQVVTKHGLSNAKGRARLAADSDMALAAKLGAGGARLSEQRVRSADLLAMQKRQTDKAARLHSVLEGREERGYEAAAKRRKTKSGGTSNKEKQRKKVLPASVYKIKARKRFNQRTAVAGKGSKAVLSSKRPQ